ITSPARNPAFSERLPFSTDRTNTPLPLFTPKKSPSCGVIFSTISPLRNDEWAMTTDTGTSARSAIIGIAGISNLKSLGMECMAKALPRLAVPADTQRDYAASRRFTDHPAQLGGTLDARAVQGQDNVVLLQASFAGGRVLIHHGDFRAMFFFQLQCAQALGRDVGNVPSEIGRAATAFLDSVAPVPVFPGTVVGKLRGLRGCDQREQSHTEQDAMRHGPPPEKVVSTGNSGSPL